MRIYKTIVNTVFVGDTNVTIETDMDGNFDILKISSIYTSNQGEFDSDNPWYVENIRENKKELKAELKELGIWEKGLIKIIESLYNEVVIFKNKLI